ncbi:hypothetical protein DKP76_10570 [Falsochrobactrum shanghaiense]|uniref:HIRAN domain-containing protein n=1 Tax=Falsochrobactrum shanghaiense TaxID=2201899 RepID=A0A316J9K3_9HYPH|nr:HIRAN domain-containing protein [Falsochrobactrum shanghaiense]PWL18154.1 hypothetical protein DKP76_10570 [Falsochrobactrum shanghaiense]
MGLLGWLFGRKRVDASPQSVNVPGHLVGRFAKDRHKPEGKWVQTTMMIKAAGVAHRKQAALEFAQAAKSASDAGQRYGVTVTPDRNNAHDQNAIAVHGFVGSRSWHVGYLDRNTAAELHHDLLSKKIPIAGELYEIYVGSDSYMEIKLIILAPPGHSMKARIKAHH